MMDRTTFDVSDVSAGYISSGCIQNITVEEWDIVEMQQYHASSDVFPGATTKETNLFSGTRLGL